MDSIKRLIPKRKLALIALIFTCSALSAVYYTTRWLANPAPYQKRQPDFVLRIRNEMKLRELHPAFRSRIREVLRELKSRNLRPRIETAWRPKADQLRAVASGSSKVRFGFHNITDSEGNKSAWAADIVDDNNARVTNPKFFFPLAKICESKGMVTGIRWGLSEFDIQLVDLSVEKEDWAGTTTMRTGWDPAHVEPVGITPAEAQAGKIGSAFDAS